MFQVANKINLIILKDLKIGDFGVKKCKKCKIQNNSWKSQIWLVIRKNQDISEDRKSVGQSVRWRYVTRGGICLFILTNYESYSNQTWHKGQHRLGLQVDIK